MKFSHHTLICITGNKWYNHFLNLHTEKCGEISDNRHYLPDEGHDDDDLNKPFTKTEFDKAVNNLKNDKAEGFDSIFNEMIKNSPSVILDLLFKFVNLCLHKSLVPQSWGMEIINPIHKDGNLNDPNNYRGICISSALLKILCSLLNNRIQLRCTEQNLINKNQIGFKKNHRTSDHLMTLKNVVKKYVTI